MSLFKGNRPQDAVLFKRSKRNLHSYTVMAASLDEPVLVMASIYLMSGKCRKMKHWAFQTTEIFQESETIYHI